MLRADLAVLAVDVVVVVARSGPTSNTTGSWNAVRILVGSGISGSIAGLRPPRRLQRDREQLQPRDLVELHRLRQPRPGPAPASSGPADGGDRDDRHLVGIAIRTKPLRPASTALSRSVQGRSESTSPPGHTATSRPAASAVEIESGARAARPSCGTGRRPRRGHQRVVRGAVQHAVLAEVAPPLKADGPGVPHERRAGVDADQQRRAEPAAFQPSISIRNQKSISGLPSHFWRSSQPGRSSRDQWPARSATHPAAPEASRAAGVDLPAAARCGVPLCAPRCCPCRWTSSSGPSLGRTCSPRVPAAGAS